MLKQVDSYLRIVGEPKLPSSFLQVVVFLVLSIPDYSFGILYVDSFHVQIICWVLGEYGTADGKYSASYIIGKLCDVAEAHLTDDTVKVCILTL